MLLVLGKILAKLKLETVVPKFIITGLTGAGKTSLLRALEREFFRCFEEVPFSSKGQYSTLKESMITVCTLNEEELGKSIEQGAKEFKGCIGVIFVVDLARRDAIQEASALLDKILNHTTPETELAILGHKIDITGMLPFDEIIESLQLGSLPLQNCHTFRLLHTSVLQEDGLSTFVDWICELVCETEIVSLQNNINEIFIHDSNGVPSGYAGDISGDAPILVSAVYRALESFLLKIGEGSVIKTLVVEGDQGPVHVANYSGKKLSVLFVLKEGVSSAFLKRMGEAVLDVFEPSDSDKDDYELAFFDKTLFIQEIEEIVFSCCPSCGRFKTG